jgi:hypothetical protein
MTFLVWGSVCDELLNVFYYKANMELPGATGLVVRTFPLNQYNFFSRVSPIFCGSMVLALLLTSTKKPLIDRQLFTECAFFILVLFGLYCAFFVWALIVPHHLLLIVADGPPTPLTILDSILNYAVWIGVLLMAARSVLLRMKRKG